PLTAIRTHLQVARMTEGQRAEHAVNQAARAAERMQATLEQLLLLARIESNAAFENSARASARDIAEAACQELSAHGAAGNIVLHAEAGPPVLVAAPAALVSVALRNLLDNAQRFSPQGEPVELTLRHEP